MFVYRIYVYRSIIHIYIYTSSYSKLGSVVFLRVVGPSSLQLRACGSVGHGRAPGPVTTSASLWLAVEEFKSSYHNMDMYIYVHIVNTMVSELW